MNILIISFDADPPYLGGVATMTNILAKGFIENGHSCALGYSAPSEHPSTFFQNKIKISKDNTEEIKRFAKVYQFDVILSQFCNIDYTLLDPLRKKHSIIVSVYHSRPMLHSLRIETLLSIYHKSNNLLYKFYTIAKITLLPFYYIRGHRKSKLSFQKAYQCSDCLVLLSIHFYPLLKKIVPNIDKKKVTAIGNPIVFEELFVIEDLNKKQKKALIVCSTNHVKRIPVLFKIWKEIELDKAYQNWSLSFVGAGEGFEQICLLAKKMGLERIHFTGYTPPLPYYRESAIQLMTSKYEGWPMVLMEGQQMGVVPICYNSFESLTDIITDGYNGMIIQNNDMSGFINALKRLMSDDDARKQMAGNAIASSSNHSRKNTINQYLNLFSNILREKECL